MIDSEIKIQLHYHRIDFENIYYKNRQGNIFWSKTIKQHFIIFLVFGTLFLISLTYSFFTNLMWALPIFILFLFSLSIRSYWINASPIIKWKKQVALFLNKLDKINRHEITLTQSALILTQDEEVIVTKWIRFTKAVFNDESIQLSGNEECMFPKNSMTNNEYALLKQFILDRIKNES